MANSPHDALFRYTFGQPEHAVPLLRALLPSGVAEALDWSTLALLPGTRIDRRLRRHQTDLLFSAMSNKDGGRECVLIHVLVEHSSRVSRWMAFRMLDYSMGIWRQLLRQRPRPERLPRIVSVVLHHGRHGWWAATEFAALLDTAGPVSWQQPQFRYVVKSLAEMSPQQLEGLALSLLGTVTLAALQYLPGASVKQLAATFARWGGLMQRLLLAPSGEEAMMALSEYVLTTNRVAPDVLIELVETEVSRRASKIMETTATRLRREGWDEGRDEGRDEGSVELLTGMLVARFGVLPLWATDRLTQASAKQARRWGLRLLEAKSVADVFAEDLSDG